MTQFHELAKTRRTSIRAATADLDESKRSELALKVAEKKGLEIVPLINFNFLIFHSCEVLFLRCPQRWYLSSEGRFNVAFIDAFLIWSLKMAGELYSAVVYVSERICANIHVCACAYK